MEGGWAGGKGVGVEFPIRCDESLCGRSQRGEVVSWHHHPHGEKQSPSEPVGEIHLQVKNENQVFREHFSGSIQKRLSHSSEKKTCIKDFFFFCCH